jgi:signal transduction histidine kinase
LGLSIVKHITQVHGGRVNVKSEIDKGSTFSLFIPNIKSNLQQSNKRIETKA